MAQKYRKKPVVIEAVRFDGANYDECLDFMYGQANASTARLGTISIGTLEGVMEASAGDWIIKGVNGEFYPCKPDIFAKTYESVGPPPVPNPPGPPKPPRPAGPRAYA